jgi:ACS family D-galactonate transporter-like MFS transporter
MRRWSLVCLLSIGLAFAYTHRTNISFATATPEFVAYFRLSDPDRGLLNSAFFWTYGLLQIPAGFLVDRFGPKWPLSAGVLLWCLFSAACGLANGLWALLGLRMLLGLGEAVITPAGLRWIRDHIEEPRRGTATGIFFAGSKYGPAVAAPIAAFLIKHHGWRSMFIDQGLAGLIWLVPWLLLASSGRPVGATKEPEAPPFLLVLKMPLMWGTLIGTFAYNYFVFYALSWLPSYFVEHRHVPLTSSGLYSGFSYGGMAAMAIFGGFAADWFIARGSRPLATRRAFTIAGLLIASTEVFGAFASTLNGALFFSILSMAGLGLATANYWSLPQTATPKALAGRVAGAQNMALTLAGIVAPILTGWLLKWSGGYAAPMAATGVILMLGVGAYVFLVRETPELSSGADL